MNFQATSPHIKFSCYNCSHFQMSEDMLNGLCSLHQKKQSAIGTCESIEVKVIKSKRNSIFN